MAVMYFGWKWLKKTKIQRVETMDLESDVYEPHEGDFREDQHEKTFRGKVEKVLRWIF